MGVITSQSFACDWPQCNATSTEERDFGWYSLSWRSIDGSSGVLDRHYCSQHEARALAGMNSANIIPPPAPKPHLTAPEGEVETPVES